MSQQLKGPPVEDADERSAYLSKDALQGEPYTQPTVPSFEAWRRSSAYGRLSYGEWQKRGRPA